MFLCDSEGVCQSGVSDLGHEFQREDPHHWTGGSDPAAGGTGREDTGITGTAVKMISSARSQSL